MKERYREIFWWFQGDKISPIRLILEAKFADDHNETFSIGTWPQWLSDSAPLHLPNFSKNFLITYPFFIQASG